MISGEVRHGLLSVAPLRALPDHKAEMVSQLLYGEAVELLGHYEEFAKIKVLHDDYVGWIHESQIGHIDVSDTRSISTKNIDGRWYPTGSFVNHENKSFDPLVFLDSWLNVPYLWGGRTEFGVDCSGFSQMFFLIQGHEIPRDSKDQALLGSDIGFASQAQMGDLAFFGDQKVTHVGICNGNGAIYHASGKVRKDRLDAHGIINEDGEYTHKLRMIKRLKPLVKS